MDKLQKKFNASAKRAKALKEIAGAEPTAEQLTEIQAELEICEGLQLQIDQKKKMDAQFAKLDAIEENDGESKTAVAPTSSVEVGLSAIEKDPMAGFKTDRDFLAAVMDHGLSGRNKAEDERLQFLAIDGDGQNEGNNPDGGFLVPKQTNSEILATRPEKTAIGAATKKIPMGSNMVSVNARVDKNHSTSVSGGLVVYRRSEEALIQKSKMKFEQVDLKLNSLDGLTYVTDELLSDSPQSIPALIGDGFGDEFDFKLDGERLFGTGVGQYEGITKSGSFLSVTRGTANKILIDDVLAMYARWWRRGGTGMWMANDTCLPQIAKLMISTDNGVAGTPAFMPSINDGVPARLMGVPIIFTEHAETLGTSNDLMLADWSQYLEGSKGGVNSAESVHVRFEYNEKAFKFGMRNDGRSWWKTKLTPKKGDTKSPFIGLGAAS